VPQKRDVVLKNELKARFFYGLVKSQLQQLNRFNDNSELNPELEAAPVALEHEVNNNYGCIDVFCFFHKFFGAISRLV